MTLVHVSNFKLLRMTIIERYYIKEFLYTLFIITTGLSLLFGIFELLDKLDEFLKFAPVFSRLLLYWLYISPKYLLYLLPISILMCTLLIFGKASRHREIIAIKASGERMKKLFIPFILLGIFFVGFDFVMGEFIVNPLTLRAKDMEYKLKRKTDRVIYKEGNLWLKGKEGMLLNAEIYLPEKGILKNVSIFYLKKALLTEIIKADKGIWNGKQWVLKNVKKYDLLTSEIVRMKNLNFDAIKSPKIYNESVLKPEEMSFRDLYKYNKRLNEIGYRNSKILVDMYSKISYPFTCFFTVLIGIAISARYRMGSGLINAGIGLIISIFFWITYTMAISLGYSGILPPFISAWVVPFCFGLAGLYFYVKIPE